MKAMSEVTVLEIETGEVTGNWKGREREINNNAGKSSVWRLRKEAGEITGTEIGKMDGQIHVNSYW